MATFGDILEQTTGRYRGYLTDESGRDRVPLAQLTSVTLTLASVHTGEIINDRDAQDVFNDNGVAIVEIETNAGLMTQLTWTVDTEDNAILDDSLEEEQHRATFTWTWDAGEKLGRWEVILRVRNLQVVM